jgi:hypothetical protein
MHQMRLEIGQWNERARENREFINKCLVEEVTSLPLGYDEKISLLLEELEKEGNTSYQITVRRAGSAKPRQTNKKRRYWRKGNIH